MTRGLDWAFDRAERLVILEDDCLPHPRFFDYCRELLHRYQDRPEVMMISGDQFNPNLQISTSYYFSRWTHIWGWASWRRAWQLNDPHLRAWPQEKIQDSLASWCDSPAERDHWQPILDAVYRGEIDTWDFTWMYSCWRHQGLTILPRTNLVSNLGFGAEATHTTSADSPLAQLPTDDFGEWVHPPEIHRNRTADQWTFANIFVPTMSSPARPARPHWFLRWGHKFNRWWSGAKS
jgi:hypothetical protein